MQFKLACAFLVPLMIVSNGALAQNLSDVSENIVSSGALLPGFVTAICYLLGILFAFQGVLKLKQHVENPGQGINSGQMPIRVPMIRFLIGGAFFSVPIVTEVLYNTFTGADGLDDPMFDPNSAITLISGVLGSVSSIIPTLNVNNILANITNSLENTPGLIAAFAYLLALLSMVSGLLRLKEHVETPEQTTIKEPVIRLLVAGALFALPTIYKAMYVSIDGPEDGGIFSMITEILGGFQMLFSSYGGTGCNPITGTAAGILGSSSTGQLICNIVFHAGAFPAFLTAISYLFGLVMGVWGILKIRDHVLNPQQATLMDGVSRLLAGGAFFALPIMVEVFRNTLADSVLSTGVLLPSVYNDGGGILGGLLASLGFSGGACPSSADLGLDGMLVCFMNDVLGPVHVVLNFFSFVAGMIFIMIGISRLTKSVQEGAKGPGGIGTLMTFITGGALISYNELVRATVTTLTGNPATKTYATMSYTTGLTDAEVGAAHAVISAVLKFMIMVGLISFVRGLFMVRSVAEGNQQASMMAAISHMVAGAVAVNLGALLNAIQATLGISAYGISFTTI